jgi:predicted PurR-regulated permease PerM
MFNNKVQLTIPAFPAYFFIFALVALISLAYILYAPFVTVLVFAAITAVIFYPLNRRLRKLFGNRERLSSMFTCIITFLVILIPLSLFSMLLFNEARHAFQDIINKINSGFFVPYFKWEQGNFIFDTYQSVTQFLTQYINFDSTNFDIFSKISEAAQNAITWLGEAAIVVGSNIFSFLLSLIIFFFSLYYFFKDGDRITKKFMDLSPLPMKHEKAIFLKFKEVSLAMLFGIFFTAIVQGVMAGIGYVVVGIPNPIFWATATGVFSLVPLIGTAAIWIPASIILLALGNYVGGVGLFLWGMLVVSTVDNFVRPYLIEGKAPVHPLMTFLAVLGGVFAFGLPGIIFGPLILNLLIAFLHIYEMEYAKVLKH